MYKQIKNLGIVMIFLFLQLNESLWRLLLLSNVSDFPNLASFLDICIDRTFEREIFRRDNDIAESVCDETSDECAD